MKKDRKDFKRQNVTHLIIPLLRFEDGGEECRQAEARLAHLTQRDLGRIGFILGLKRHFGGAL